MNHANSTPITTFELADQILNHYQTTIGKDWQGYRNHVTRMLNYCWYLLRKDQIDISQSTSNKLQIAAAFHDIALWTHNRVDYLEPSYQDSHRYLSEQQLQHWQEEIQIIIDMHHLLTPYHGPHAQLVEIFRRADLVDFSLGTIKHGISADFIKAVQRALPNAGFHKALLRFSLKQLGTAPWDPLPMLRVKNRYRHNQ